MTLLCGCPSSFPDWHGQDIDLGGGLAHVLSVPMLFHMPLAIGLYIQRQQHTLEKLGLAEKWPGMVLIRTGFFRGSLTRLLEPSRSPARNLQVLPRPFYVHVALHHGNLSTARKVIQQMQMGLVDKGCMPKELYLAYLTCPRCAEERGGEKLLLLRHWEESARLKKRLSARG